MINRKLIFFLFFFFLTLIGFGQTLKVRGKIFDSETKNAVPFANVALNDKIHGTISDINGEFFIEKKSNADSIIISCVGYKKATFPLSTNAYQELNLYLDPINIEIEEVVVKPGENPAHPILRKIKENKPNNNPEKISSFQYEVYNKMELDFDNLSEEFQKRKALKQFQFVFDNMDTSALTGKAYLPMFITETISDFYFQAPSTTREVIKASKIAGMEDPTLSQFTGKMMSQLNIYKNFLEIIVPGFISPISDYGLLYYKYYLIDSIMEGGNLYYKITYEPKRESELAFSGYFTVDKNSYGIKEIKMKLNKGVNINYINNFAILIDYEHVNNEAWFVSKEEYEVEFNIRDKGKGFIGKKFTTYSNIKINKPLPLEIEKQKINTIIEQDATLKNDEFWQNARPHKLSEHELKIYETVDSIKKVPLFEKSVTMLNMLYAYYYDFGAFEFGPYYRSFSYNEIEGYRLRLGGQTSTEISTKHRFYGHVAYGFKDERYKYGLGYICYMKRIPWTSYGISITDDIKLLGQSSNAFKEDNFMTAFLRRNPNYKLTMVKTYEGFFERDWIYGLSNNVSFKWQKILPTEYVPFSKYINENVTIKYPEIITAEINLRTHFEYNEQFIYGNFERTSVSIKQPIFNVDMTFGIPDVWGSQFKYFKLKLNATDRVDINPFGYFRYLLDAGKIWGTLPYPLIEIHKGNETFAYDIYAFNRMNYYEFVSDDYVKIFIEQHFQGFFFNKVPLLKKLNLREVVHAQALIGRLNPKHAEIYDFPAGLGSLHGPYIETGIGVENILRLIRLDLVWRATQKDPSSSNFVLMMSMKIDL